MADLGASARRSYELVGKDEDVARHKDPTWEWGADGCELVERDDEHSKLMPDRVIVDPIDPEAKRQKEWLAALQTASAGLGNFSIQYNMGCAGIILSIMTSAHDTIGPNVHPDFPEPLWVKYSLLSSVFVGSVLGMLVMGQAVDKVGARTAMLITLSCTVVGAIICGVAYGGVIEIYSIITVGRFVLGFGVGGIYPVAAVTATTSSSDPKETADKVGWAFFWQGPGACAPYVAALLVMELSSDTGRQFRILFLLGAIPALLVVVLTLLQPARPARRSPGPPSAVAGSTLCATASIWFLFDVAYYGTLIFTPEILSDVFGSHQTLSGLAMHSLFVTATMMPGTLASICAMRWLGVKRTCACGFIGMWLVFTALAFIIPRIGSHQLLFGAYIVLYFFLTFGPNTCTYVLPMLVFPEEVRGSYHGLSAAAGKSGAVVGALIFEPMKDAWGLSVVMGFQALVCLLALIITVSFVPDIDKVELNSKRGA